MRVKTLKSTLEALYTNQHPPRAIVIEGPPGGGKTTVCQQIAKELDIGYIEKHMPTMLVEDFGIPFLQATDDGDVLGNDMLHYKLPNWYPAEGRFDIPTKGLLCFDDRNQASSDLQKVLANICQARNLHGVPLAEGWMVVATGNRQSDRAGANRVLSHLRNRETVYELETHLDDWTSWAVDNNVHPEVISFIHFRPELLHKFDPTQDQCPTPRSWVEGVSNALGIVPPEAEFETFKGAVGEGSAAEFMGYLRIYRDLPDIDSIIADPEGSKVPTDPATLYAISGSLSYKVTAKNFENACKYLARIPKEFGVMCVSQAIKRNDDIQRTRAFVTWATENQSVIF